MKKQKTRRWHLFGNCGGWNEFHVWCYTEKQALMEAQPHLKFYGEAYLKDCNTGKEWKVKRP